MKSLGSGVKGDKKILVVTSLSPANSAWACELNSKLPVDMTPSCRDYCRTRPEERPTSATHAQALEYICTKKGSTCETFDRRLAFWASTPAFLVHSLSS